MFYRYFNIYNKNTNYLHGKTSMKNRNISLKDYMASLSLERQEKIKKHAEELREQNVLGQIREISQHTQPKMSDYLDIPLSTIATMEKKPYVPSLSEVKRYAEAVGCEVALVLTKPDGEEIFFDI